MALPGIWSWLLETPNQQALKLIGGAIAAICGAIAWAYRIRRERKMDSAHLTDGPAQMREAAPPPASGTDPRLASEIDPQLYNDVAYRTELAVSKLPLEPQQLDQLMPMIDRLFLRPAFYDWPERDPRYALWAVMYTRFVWEQQVMLRLPKLSRDKGADVLRALLQVEEAELSLMKIPAGVLSRIVDSHMHNKWRFALEVGEAQPPSWQSGAMKRYEQVSDALKQLRKALSDFGIAPTLVGGGKRELGSNQ